MRKLSGALGACTCSLVKKVRFTDTGRRVGSLDVNRLWRICAGWGLFWNLEGEGVFLGFRGPYATV